MTYYKAQISMTTEELEKNEVGEYEGVNPNTYKDFGLIRTLTAPTIEGIKKRIEEEYFNLEKPIGAGVQIFQNLIEITYAGEHDYQTPKAEQIPFIENVYIYICKVEDTEIDLLREETFSKVYRGNVAW